MTTFCLDVNKTLQNKDLALPIQNLYITLRDVGFITPGDYFEKLSPTHLNILRGLADNSSRPNGDNAIEELMLLGMGLTLGEGLDLTEEQSMDGVTLVILYISLEVLDREGLCNAIRKNWSMDKHTDLPVAAPREESR